MNAGRIVGLAADSRHRFSKRSAQRLDLLAGHGFAGDAHAGTTVQHLSRVEVDPTQPNLRQVHLIHVELLAELTDRGWPVAPGDLGENITTEGVDLLALPRGTRLRLGDTAVIEITGLRNPCAQIERFQSGLLGAVLDRAADGALIRKSGVMAIAITDGVVRVGDPIGVALPSPPYQPLAPV